MKRHILAVLLIALLPMVAGSQETPLTIEEALYEGALENLRQWQSQPRTRAGSHDGETQSADGELSSDSVLPRASASQILGCIPSCEPHDSRLLAVTPPSALASLSTGKLEFEVMVAADASEFQIGVFDGDTGGFDDEGERHWDFKTPATLTFTLYADPLKDGTGTFVVDTFDGSTMPDNDWVDFTVNTGLEAQAPSGHYFYRFVASLPDSAPPAVMSAFKVRASNAVTIEQFQQPIGFIANIWSLGDIKLVYPEFPALSPTTYDGTFTFYLDFAEPQSRVAIWDGDLDRGSFDFTYLDTDDANTDNDVLPDWSEPDSAAHEGVAVGPNGALGVGNPPDDKWFEDADGIYEEGEENSVYMRGPAIRYHVIAPDGRVLTNNNPSGNSEWERFSLASGVLDPDVNDLSLTEIIPNGTVSVVVEGLDFQNLSFFFFPEPVICAKPDGSPCEAFRAFLIGDTVFLDSDGDGNQDSDEPGIPDVLVELLDINGNVVATTVTGADGYYEFEVDAGEHVVTVSGDNFLSGGVLEGMVTTTGDSFSTTIIDENDMTLDFGYRPVKVVGTGTPGYWKNHPDAWPSDPISIGGVDYEKADAIALMKAPTKGDMTRVMFQHLVSTKLNVAIGTEPSCIVDTINAADEWMATYPVGTRVKANSPAWQDAGNDLKNQLDAYNNGLLCAPHRG